VAENMERTKNSIFQSFYSGGFECSTQRLRSGRRLDMIAATGHDKHARADYARLRAVGMRTARDGLRWHLIEQIPGQYDFSSVLPLVRAARESGVQVIWDVCHYGWPDDLDVFEPEFVSRLAGLARAFTGLLANETDEVPFISPINEISFFSWAGGDEGVFYPYARGRGDELKMQLVRAAIACIEAVWDVDPRARIVHIDPVVNVVARPERPWDEARADGYRLAQYSAWDMICGLDCPHLGGDQRYLDIIGLNYYLHNQWFYPDRQMIPFSHPLYRPLRELLREVSERYGCPMFIAETGIEDDLRPAWLRYIGREVRAGLSAGVPIEGVCLYPIVNHPGWEDERHCYNGLWDYADETGEREICQPLSMELRRQMRLLERFRQTDDIETEGSRQKAGDGRQMAGLVK
jgi:hypothetical protein